MSESKSEREIKAEGGIKLPEQCVINLNENQVQAMFLTVEEAEWFIDWIYEWNEDYDIEYGICHVDCLVDYLGIE